MVKFLVWGSEDLNYVPFLALLQTVSLCDLKQINESLGGLVPFSKDDVADLVSLDNKCLSCKSCHLQNQHKRGSNLKTLTVKCVTLFN